MRAGSVTPSRIGTYVYTAEWSFILHLTLPIPAVQSPALFTFLDPTPSLSTIDRCRHFMIDALDDGQYVIIGEDRRHRCLQDLVDYHRRAPIIPFNEVLTVACGQVSGGAGSNSPDHTIKIKMLFLVCLYTCKLCIMHSLEINHKLMLFFFCFTKDLEWQVRLCRTTVSSKPVEPQHQSATKWHITSAHKYPNLARRSPTCPPISTK